MYLCDERDRYTHVHMCTSARGNFTKKKDITSTSEITPSIKEPYSMGRVYLLKNNDITKPGFIGGFCYIVVK